MSPRPPRRSLLQGKEQLPLLVLSEMGPAPSTAPPTTQPLSIVLTNPLPHRLYRNADYFGDLASRPSPEVRQPNHQPLPALVASLGMAQPLRKLDLRDPRLKTRWLPHRQSPCSADTPHYSTFDVTCVWPVATTLVQRYRVPVAPASGWGWDRRRGDSRSAPPPRLSSL